MKTNFKLIAVLVIAPYLFASCGGSSDENGSVESTESSEEVKPEIKKLSPSNCKISNMDKKLFKMTDSEIEIELVDSEYGDFSVSCEFELVSTYTGSATQIFVSAVALDKKGKTIEFSTVTNGEMRTDDSEGKQFLDFLMGEPGSKARFTFNGGKYTEAFKFDYAATKKAMDQIESIKILTDDPMN